MVEPVAPQGALAEELGEVARSATGMRHALKGANFLPEDFPRGDLDAVAATLEQTPQMSADGALDALTYARPKLSQLRRVSVKIADVADDLPDVQRGGAIDQAMTRLIADVDTAREWYYEARKEAAAASEFPEDAVAPAGSAEFAKLAARAQSNADQSKAIADELADGATPGSVVADNLVRRVRDVEVLSRQEGIELAASQPRLRLLDRLGWAVGRCASFVSGALFAVEAGADFAKIGWERFSNIATRQISVVLEEARDWAAETRARIAHYRQKWADEQQAPLPPRPSRLAAVVHVGVDARTLPDLSVFKDVAAPWCPEMVVIPAGTFWMGSPDSDPDGRPEERPRHRVTIGYRFALGRYPVTFEEYDYFCAETNNARANDKGWGRGRMPVNYVGTGALTPYCDWLSTRTGHAYRLPSEAEWEYACRAGTTTRYACGDHITEKDANFGGRVGKPTEVGAYPPNAWGLYDMHGNLCQRVADIWQSSYLGAPSDGSAWRDTSRLPARLFGVVRGGSWNDGPVGLRSADRGVMERELNYVVRSFRVARAIE